MKQTAIALAIASLSTLTATAGTVTSDGADIVIKTNGGFEAKTTDGLYSFKVGGRIQADYNDYDGVINAVPGESGSDAFFRRARLEVKGHAKDWGYLMSYNLTSGGSIDQLHTTYTGWGKLANLTVGQQKENFGLDDTGSSNWTTAIERALPANAFDAGNNLGIKLHGANDLLSYSVGAFKTGIDSDNDLDSALTGRFVVRPYLDGGNVVHLGIGATRRDGVAADYNSRLGARGGEDGTGAGRVRARIANTLGDREDYNLEAAANLGPFHVMAEYFDGEIDVDGVGATIEADGYYLQAGWVLTGESRGYKTDIAAFDGVKPASAGGAWELFARFDALDVANPAPISVAGEKADSITLGVNWYLNSLVKVSLNYVDVGTDRAIGGEDEGDALLARLQVAF
ncbi:MAG: porin [Porticoccaceae bacterium]|jgi:phosphate-selective porin OprO/OprP|nr:porin [Porticoccaceae bacterium]MEA3301024.1 porin [Pseudomonadota bacterium]HLS98611.1 porin [Porticoccaceae bacterium]